MAYDAPVARVAITHHHPVATCAMGRDEAAITDADLAMRGLDNLWIVDASVIPSITAGPIHAAVMAIAESFASGFRGCPHRPHWRAANTPTRHRCAPTTGAGWQSHQRRSYRPRHPPMASNTWAQPTTAAHAVSPN